MFSMQDEVKGLLEKMCSLLPSEYKEKCDGFIVEYFDLIWGIMKQEVVSCHVWLSGHL